MKGKSGGVSGAAMKKFGRNVARAKNQQSASKVQGYAVGGAVKVPPMPKDMGGFSGGGMDGSGFGGGTARGGKAASKGGKKFSGTF